MTQPPYPGYQAPDPGQPQQPYGQQPQQQPYGPPPPVYPQPQQPQAPQAQYGQYPPQQQPYPQPPPPQQQFTPAGPPAWQQPTQSPPKPPNTGLYLGIGGGGIATIIVVIVLIVAFNRGGGSAPSIADPSGSSDPQSVTTNDATLNVAIRPPEHLLPGQALYEADNTVLQGLYAGLTRTDPSTGLPVNRLAESITSPDSKVWTIKLKPAYKFQNGEPVTADSFVDAWNFNANSTNGQGGSFFFDRIAGYAEAQSAAKTMSGLVAVDDTTFTVTLAKPWAVFPTALAHPAMSPMAKECLAAITTCEASPIGNGPFQAQDSWSAGTTELTMTRWDDFAGDKPQYGSVHFRFIEDPALASAMLGDGGIDLARMWNRTTSTPPDGTIVSVPTAQIAYLGFPTTVDPYKSPELRRAISLSIDREELVKVLGLDYLKPADSFAPPGIPGHVDGTCADCRFDPTTAKSVFVKAKWPKGKAIEFAYSATNQTTKEFLEVVCQSVKAALTVDCVPKPTEFAAFSDSLNKNAFKTAWVSGWIPDQANTEAFLTPLYGPGNHFGYSNPTFDGLIAQGNAQLSIDAALPFYEQAEALLNADMPAIPFTNEQYVAGLGEKIVADSFHVDPSTEAPQLDLLKVRA